MLQKVIKLLFTEKINDVSTVITDEDFKGMDRRVKDFLVERQMFHEFMYSPNEATITGRKSLFDYGIDKWSDEMIAKLVIDGAGPYGSNFVTSNRYSMKNQDFSGKLTDKCSKDTIKTFLNKYPSSTAKIIAMMKKFTALTVGKSITDGNIKLTIS